MKTYRVKLKEEYYDIFCPARYAQCFGSDTEFMVVSGMGWDGKLNYKIWDEENGQGDLYFKEEELIFLD